MESILGSKNNEEGPYTGHPGTGTQFDPWIVHDRATLLRVGTEALSPDPDDLSWHLGAHYRQVRNITLPAPEPGDSNWIPIGISNITPFTGTYNGNGRTITGLIINTIDINQGMFGHIDTDGIVQNLGLINVSITAPSNVGGVAGNNLGTIQNCYVTGIITVVNGNAGGLVGWNYSIVQYSYSTVIINGSGDDIGGLIGINQLGTVENSYFSGTVSGDNNIGGVVGDNNSGIVQSCYARGTVSGDNNIGGVVGNNRSDISSPGTVQSCYSTSTVSGNSSVGGIAGQSGGLGSIIQNCYATGAVNGTTNVGGVAGTSSGNLQNCVALNQSISGTSNFYRIVGTNSGGLSSNYARDIPPTDSGGSGISGGEPIATIELFYTHAWWLSPWSANPGDGWDTSAPWFWGTIWNNAGPTRLPTLRNMPGRTQNPTAN